MFSHLLEELTEPRKAVIRTVTVYHSKGKKKSAKRRGTQGGAQERPAAGFRLSLPVKSHVWRWFLPAAM